MKHQENGLIFRDSQELAEQLKVTMRSNTNSSKSLWALVYWCRALAYITLLCVCVCFSLCYQSFQVQRPNWACSGGTCAPAEGSVGMTTGTRLFCLWSLLPDTHGGSFSSSLTFHSEIFFTRWWMYKRQFDICKYVFIVQLWCTVG